MTSIISFLIVFTVVVLVHELGHYLAARRLGVKAYEFSIGFPFSPKIATLFRIGETDFTIRLLPLGGFVSFAKDNEEAPEFLNVERPKRAVILSAGSVFNIIFAFIAIAASLMIGKDLGVLEAARQSILSIKEVATGTFNVLASLFSSNPSFDGLSGPVGIAVMAGAAAKSGIAALLYFTGMLSLSLGIFNLLPFPALDGGHLVILALESIKRKSFSTEAYTFIGAAGIALFVLLTIAVTYKDVIRIAS